MLFAGVTSGGVLRIFTRQLEKLCFFPFFIPGCCVLHIPFHLFFLAIFTVTKNRVLLSTLAITFTFSQCLFPFHSAFSANCKLVVKKFFLWTFLTTREKGKMQINPNLCFICRKWWSTSKSQTDVCSAMCWNMNDILVG